MGENIAGMRVEGTRVAGREAGHSRSRTPIRWVAISGAVAAMLAVALVAGMVPHQRGASGPSAPVAPRTVTGQQARFEENNTTNLPNAATADIGPIAATTVQQRFLEVNTTMLPHSVAASVAPPVVTIEQQRFLAVNGTWLPVGTPNSSGEEVTPTIGHPR